MSKLPIKHLDGIKVQLKPFSLDFVTNNYLNWMNDKETTRFIYKAQGSTSLEELRSFAKQMINSQIDYFFAILIKTKQYHIGNVRLGPINFNTMNSKFGILIGDKSFHGLGIGSEVLELIKDFGFNYLNLNKLSFNVVKNHTAAMRLYEKSNFTCLGEVEKKFIKDGKTLKLVEWAMENPNNAKK